MTFSKPTPAQIKELSDKFADEHFVKFDAPFEQDRIGIYWLQKVIEDVDLEIRSKMDVLVASDSTWRTLQTMLHRVHEHCEGSFISFVTGAWASTEVNVRAVMEAAVNVMYITSKDKEKRLIQYLYHFWSSEKDFSQKRLRMVSRLKGDIAITQKESVEFNIEYNDFRENLINTILKNDGFSSLNEPGWPVKIVDRFVDLGLETEYRTTYSFLSAEAHNDASALVDFMIHKALEEYVPEEAGLEVYLRVRMYLYMGLEYFIKAAVYYSASFSLDVTDEILQAHKAVCEIKNSIAYEITNLRNSIQPLKNGEKLADQKQKKHRKRR